MTKRKLQINPVSIDSRSPKKLRNNSDQSPSAGDSISASLPPKFWLLKSEPEEYSVDDLAQSNDSTGFWDGVRNFQARNNLKRMVPGEKILFYHSSCKVPAIVGIASVVSDAVPDSSALNPGHKYFDPKSDPENPKWFGLEIKFDRKLKRPITLQELKTYRS